ncbi:MAG TPA: hypothetical protein VFG84_12300 [Gemmatimonadaceae bacterium]|nr:hypothetical protein [Gemmatimonadaceae bacterium]
MRHFFRTSLSTADVLAAADAFFPTVPLNPVSTAPRARSFAGTLGTLHISARPEGGHYTFVEADTDQMGESRLDRNVKRFFASLHRQVHPGHAPLASY